MLEPKLTRADGLLHLRYVLNRQVYTSDVYPFLSPNGSKIILCGHETGLLILWRGGRPFNDKRRHSRQSSGQNTPAVKGDDFEDEELEEQRYPPIVQELDLPLGTAVLHIAFPPIPQLSRPQETPLSPALLQDNLVVALACADSSIRLLTIPLQPPSPALFDSKKLQLDVLAGVAGNGIWGEKLVIISNAHINPAKGVSIAFASQAQTQPGTERDVSGTDILIASHSTDLSGLLVVHRIALETSKEAGFGFDQPELWRRQQLSSPACSIDLYVSKDTGPRVLLAESAGAVRIYECSANKATNQGHWSLSLFATSPTVAATRSSAVHTARWVLAGDAIAVLTTDGNWGIWNISHDGPARGISGVRPTPFTISGRVGTVVGSIAPKSSHGKAENKSQLAPMTPAARKARQEALFGGKTDTATKCGGITIKHITGALNSGESDESLLFWHGESIVYLPSLRTHWHNKFQGRNNVFTSAASGHLRDVPTTSLGGEARVAVSVLPPDDVQASTSRNLDVVIAGERSLLISMSQPSTRIVPTNDSTANQSRIYDQSLLSKGLLDVNGLDRLLDGMRSGGTSIAGSSAHTQRKMLFQ